VAVPIFSEAAYGRTAKRGGGDAGHRGVFMFMAAFLSGGGQ